MLLYTSFLDLKSREIEPRIWLYYGIPLAFLTVIEAFFTNVPVKLFLFSLFFGLITVGGLSGVLYYVGLLGGGDVFGLIVIGIAHPVNPIHYIYPSKLTSIIFPPIITTLLFASLAASALSIIIFFNNILRHRKDLARLPSKSLKIAYLFTATPIKAGDLVEKKFWYPLERPWEKNRFRLNFNVEEDDAILRGKINSLIKEGRIESKTKIWSTYGIPFIIYIFLGYIIMLIGGENAILMILQHIG